MTKIKKIVAYLLVFVATFAVVGFLPIQEASANSNMYFLVPVRDGVPVRNEWYGNANILYTVDRIDATEMFNGFRRTRHQNRHGNWWYRVEPSSRHGATAGWVYGGNIIPVRISAGDLHLGGTGAGLDSIVRSVSAPVWTAPTSDRNVSEQIMVLRAGDTFTALTRMWNTRTQRSWLRVRVGNTYGYIYEGNALVLDFSAFRRSAAAGQASQNARSTLSSVTTIYSFSSDVRDLLTWEVDILKAANSEIISRARITNYGDSDRWQDAVAGGLVEVYALFTGGPTTRIGAAANIVHNNVLAIEGISNTFRGWQYGSVQNAFRNFTNYLDDVQNHMAAVALQGYIDAVNGRSIDEARIVSLTNAYNRLYDNALASIAFRQNEPFFANWSANSRRSAERLINGLNETLRNMPRQNMRQIYIAGFNHGLRATGQANSTHQLEGGVYYIISSVARPSYRLNVRSYNPPARGNNVTIAHSYYNTRGPRYISTTTWRLEYNFYAWIIWSTTPGINLNAARYHRAINNTNVNVWNWVGEVTQRWYIRDMGNGQFALLSQSNPYLAITVTGSRDSIGQYNVTMAYFDGRPTQLWTFTPR